jgi:hypothetical protein
MSAAQAAIALVLALAAQVNGERPWTDAGVKDGAILAYRDDAVSDVREARATSELPFAADAIAAVVCDFTQYGALVPGVQEARLLEGDRARDHAVYLRYAPRYLVVAARDVVVRVERHVTPDGVVECRWSEVAGRVPEQRGVVRMPVLRGRWTIEPLAPSQSRVTYQLAVKPGGRLPAWLVRRGALDALPDAIGRLRQHLRATPFADESGASAHDRRPFPPG